MHGVMEEGGMDNTVYDSLKEMLDDTFREAAGEAEREGLGRTEYKAAVMGAWWKDQKPVILTGLLFGAVGFHALFSAAAFLRSMLFLTTAPLSSNPLRYAFWAVTPFLLWIWSTKYDFYNFWNRKMAFLMLCIINMAGEMLQVVSLIMQGILMPFFLAIPLSRDVTPGMVANLFRLALVLSCVLPVLASMRMILAELNHELTKKRIVAFKLGKMVDGRRDAGFAYDMKIVRNLETGEVHNIKEKDRFLHSLANGVTGTGKTSSCFTTAITADLEQIVRNKEYQKRECRRLLQAGHIRLKYPMEDRDFDIDGFEGVDEKHQKALEEMKYRAKVAGITAIAPDASFSDEVYALARAKGLEVNRLDPLLGDDGHLKPGFIGFNPIYISPGLSRIEFFVEVSRKAVMVAEVMQAIYDSEGSSDVYFASLNKNITTTLTQLVCFTYPQLHHGEQPTLEHVQMVLNHFPNAMEYRDMLVELYAERDGHGRILTNEYGGGKPVMQLPMFQTILDVVDNDILGDGADKMNDQCRGLRVIFNTLFTDLNIRNVLCSRISIDIEETLEKGQVTVVNFALELGSAGKALGLFYMLCLISAAYRRKGTEGTRIPNFCYIDEFPQLLHPSEEQCFVLFRKYRVAMFVAVQSLSQMDKARSTAFMKQILIGNCAHHFVFGRASTEEMELYEKLGGVRRSLQETKQTSETALSADTPSISFGTREQMQVENVIEGGDVHNRDFQEVTVITVDKGSPVGVFFGKVSFLPAYKRIKRKGMQIDWKSYYHGVAADGEREDGDNMDSEALHRAFVTTSEDCFCARQAVPGQRAVQEPAFVRAAKADAGKGRGGTGRSLEPGGERKEPEDVRSLPAGEKDGFGSFEI